MVAVGPLSGVRVLDFSGLLPGPYATAILADLGAHVTRIEHPRRADLVRALSPQLRGNSAAHLALNRGKRSVAIDLKDERGVEIARKLALASDLVVEQFRPGVMRRLGLDYESLSRDVPALIYCSITGYGQKGPLALRAGHDINYLALSGSASYSGRMSEGPRLSGLQVADLAGGAQPAVIAILAALYERTSSGRGRHLDISMSDGALALNALCAPAALHSDSTPDLGSELLNGGSLYDYYRTADQRYLAIGSLEPQFAQRLFQALGHPEWGALYLRPPGQQGELREHLTQLIASRPLSDWRALFEPLDACVEPVLTLDEALDHPHFRSRGVVEEFDPIDDEGIRVVYVASAARSSFPHAKLDPGAELGDHTYEVLSELGLTTSEIENLCVEGVCASSSSPEG